MKIASFVLFLFVAQLSLAQNKTFPIIKNYGAALEVPFATMTIDPKLDYKVLIDVTTATDKPDVINENVENIARIINLHALAGVTAKKLHVVAVFHGPAVMTLLNNEAYQKKFGVNNPHLALFTALKEAGIPMYVCGQTLFKRNVDPSTIVTEVLPALSAITTITTYSAKGYTVLKY
ncbi:MAG: DsrE family protein [Sphingobacteriia bacterium]|jgi:intracellular sulfur oxidation DsrE/DsrF family protein